MADLIIAILAGIGACTVLWILAVVALLVVDIIKGDR